MRIYYLSPYPCERRTFDGDPPSLERMMRSTKNVILSGTLVLGLSAASAPARAQWTQVSDIPTTEVFSVWANGDTLAAGADTAVYVSTDAGTSWVRSAKPVAGVGAITALWVRNGRLYAGTFGQGAFISDDRGATWSAFNQGLVGGILDSQLFLNDFQVRGDSIYAATGGAGIYMRSLAGAGTWQTFGDVFEPNQASNVNGLALGGTRLLASAGSNGMVFFRDPGDPDWTISNLDNVGLHPGLQALGAVWTGAGWVVGTNVGAFRSVAGQEPWTLSGPGLGPLNGISFATQGGHLFGAFDIPAGAVIEDSHDNGATWQIDEGLAGVFVERMAISAGTLYAARGDGLWRRSTATASVPPHASASGLRFALAGPQPCRDQTRLRFDLPEAGTASIRMFDVLGRATGERIDGWWSSGPHEVSLDARPLPPGVYTALLTANGARRSVRLVHVR